MDSISVVSNSTGTTSTSSVGLKPQNTDSKMPIVILGVSVGILCFVAMIRLVVRPALKKFRINRNHHVNSQADFNLNTFSNIDDTSTAVSDNNVCRVNAAENMTITALSPDSVYYEINDEIYDVIYESVMDSISCSFVGDHTDEPPEHSDHMPSTSNECVLQLEGMESVIARPLTKKNADENIIYVDNATCVDTSNSQ